MQMRERKKMKNNIIQLKYSGIRGGWKPSLLTLLILVVQQTFAAEIVAETSSIKGHAQQYTAINEAIAKKLGVKINNNYINKTQDENTALIYADALKPLINHIAVESLVEDQDYTLTDEDGDLSGLKLMVQNHDL